MVELSLGERIKVAAKSLAELRGTFDFEEKKKRLDEINTRLQDPEVWSNQEESQKLGKEKLLEKLVDLIELNNSVEDLNELFELSEDESEANQLKESFLMLKKKLQIWSSVECFQERWIKQTLILIFSLVRGDGSSGLGRNALTDVFEMG